MKQLTTSAIILAGGAGNRMNTDKTKQFIDILGKTVIERAISPFDNSDFIDEIVLVVKPDEIESVSELMAAEGYKKRIKLVIGGACRAESAKNGFSAVSEDAKFVAIHDSARCLITTEMIDMVVKKAFETGAATAACGVYDTVKTVDENGKILSTIPRDSVYRAQTPQVFSKEIYEKALKACKDLTKITDDNMLVENIGVDVYAVDLGSENIKITTQGDLPLAKSILLQRKGTDMGEFRIGHGYDVHRLVEGRKLIIGGVEIPSSKGLLGHSDADVLIHAIMDSLLGAAGLGDIGRHFPDSKDEFYGISSVNLLTRVAELIKNNGFSVVNVDATVVLQSPKVAKYIPTMISNIAFALNISENRINIKATTEEGLGFTGSGEGAAAHSVAMLSCK